MSGLIVHSYFKKNLLHQTFL